MTMTMMMRPLAYNAKGAGGAILTVLCVWWKQRGKESQLA